MIKPVPNLTRSFTSHHMADKGGGGVIGIDAIIPGMSKIQLGQHKK